MPRSDRDAGGRELFSEERSAEVVAASFAGAPDPRLKQVLSSLVRHMHAFVKDVELAEEEWAQAIAFLTATGQKCDDVRQEFVLLSDVLGTRCGFYDVQQPGVQPELNLRGLFTADGDGRFWFRTIVPRYYPIPADGPVGRLLAATGRHPNRPAHVHFIVSAPDHRTVITHLFAGDSPYLDSDAVFGVKQSLVRPFPVVDDPARADEAGLPNPFRTVHFEVTLLENSDTRGTATHGH
ncbi:MAG TPA: dioxygenase [Streptosporangiaceae bacterium]|nr:dioxygenase [Streptosporangiaceae bacterium]